MKDPELVSIKLAGKDFACTVCECTKFVKRSLALKDPDASIFSVSRHDSAVVLICSKCGYVHWFVPRFTQKDQAE